MRTSPALDKHCKGCLDVAVVAHTESDEFLSDWTSRARRHS